MIESLNIKHEGLDLRFYENFIPLDQRVGIFDKLLKEIQWEQEELKLFGKSHLVPRLVAWYGNEEAIYNYSNKIHQPKKWNPLLLALKDQIENEIHESFNSVLLNLYRDGHDKMGWHADNEKELGDAPIIASLSFGTTRRFDLKHKERNDLEKIQLLLTDGSLLIMKGETQNFWKHQIPVQRKVKEPRINLTFRKIV